MSRSRANSVGADVLAQRRANHMSHIILSLHVTDRYAQVTHVNYSYFVLFLAIIIIGLKAIFFLDSHETSYPLVRLTLLGGAVGREML